MTDTLSENQRLRAILAAVDIGTWMYDVRTDQITADPMLCRIFGVPEATGLTQLGQFTSRIHPDDLERVNALIAHSIESHERYEAEYRLRLDDGQERTVLARGFAEAGPDGATQVLAGAVLDVTYTRLSLAREKSVLEKLARHAPLQDILQELVLSVEAASREGMLVSVMLLDESGTRLQATACGSLPERWVAAIDGLAIGPEVGSCGTAASTGSPVSVDDIASHPFWADFRDLALECGLAACTSTPIIISGNQLVGTIAVYYPTPRLPGEVDQALLDSARYLSGIAVERERIQQAVRRSEQEFRLLANTIPQLAWMADARGDIFWYNDRWYEYTGTVPADMLGWGWKSVHDPVQLPDVLERWQQSLQSGEPFEMEFPIRGANGLFRTFLTRVVPIRDSQGHLLRWFGTNTDIDEQRRNVERTRTLVEATSQAIWNADSRGLITSPSPSWSKLTGQSFADLQGLGWLEAISPQDRERVREAWHESIATGEVFSQQFQVWSTQNRFLHVRAKGVPMQSGVEWIVATTDETEQVMAQQQLNERARYAAFRNTLKEAGEQAGSWPAVAQRCCEALTSQLDFAAASVWHEGRLLAASGLEAPHDEELLALAFSHRGQLDNALSRRAGPLGDWAQGNGMQALVGQSIMVDGKSEGVLACFATVVLPVSISDEVRDAADTLAFSFKLERESRARREAEARLAALTARLPAEGTAAAG